MPKSNKNRGLMERFRFVPNAQESVLGPKVESLYRQRY